MSAEKREKFAQAIICNNASIVESMLASGFRPNARLPCDGRPPPLVLASRWPKSTGDIVIVGLLLKAGARINDSDDKKQTACHVAAFGGGCEKLPLLRLLLAHKPNLELKCDRGHTPLQTSLASDYFGSDRSVALALVEAGARLDVLTQENLCYFAASSTSAIQTLLCLGVVVGKLRGEDGRTPLHIADSARVLDTLVNECGVDLEARTKYGDTCIHIAQAKGNADALRFLIAAGGNVNVVNNHWSYTPLHLHEIINGKCTILLLAAGADVHARDLYANTPLMKVAVVEETREGKPAELQTIVNAMLAAGADLDAATHNGRTPRQCLAKSRFSFDVPKEVEAARREIAKVRLDFVRHRAWQVCIGLQSRGLDASQMCEVLLHACGPVAPLIEFHQWWKIATTAKHFKTETETD
jgi:ankyrin repeat protein